MATKLYLPNGVAAPITPPAPVGGSTWEHINSSGNWLQKALLAPDSSTLTTVEYAPDGVDHLVDNDSFHRQYVIGPLKGQTFAGNVTAQLQCLERLANCNLILTMKIITCTPAGVLRNTLLAITRASAEANTSLRNLTFTSTALAGSQTCQDGDYLVIEIGLGGNITSGSGGAVGHDGSIRWGCNASSGDLPVDNTQTGTTYRGWINFTSTIQFISETEGIAPSAASVDGQAAVFVPSTGEPAAGTSTATGVGAIVPVGDIADDFDRTGLNPVWGKFPDNPRISGDYGDPFLWFEAGTYYLFCRNQTSGNIVRFSSTDLINWANETTVLSPGTAGAWDDYAIEGPYIVKAGSTYYLFYGGQVNSGGGATTWKIGYATASSINGTYTKYGSNPVISRAGEGCNDCAVYYNAALSPAWQVFATAGNAGNKDDVSDGDFARFTASAPDGTWTDQGDVITGINQDESLVLDKQTLVMPYTPQFGLAAVQAVSSDFGATFQAALSGDLINRVAATWENTVFAPHIIKVGASWIMAYQGVNTASQIGLAWARGLHRWFPTAADAFEVIGYLHTTVPAVSAWNVLRSEYPMPPGYVLESDIYIESQADGGIMTMGLHVAQSASLYYHVLLNAAAGRVYAYSGSTPTDTGTLLQTSSALTINQATWYRLRVNVTSSGFTVDWWNGASWTNGILSQGSLTLTAARIGPLAYSPTNNLSRWRNLAVTKSISNIIEAEGTAAGQATLDGLAAYALPTIPSIDTFNRANEGPPPAGWSVADGTGFKIVSNEAIPNVSTITQAMAWTTAGSSVDVAIQVVIGSGAPANGTGAGGIWFRWADKNDILSNAYNFFFGNSGGVGFLELYKMISTVQTQVGERFYLGTALVSGDSIAIQMIGSNCHCFVNGIYQCTFTNGDITTGNYLGVLTSANNGTTYNAVSAQPGFQAAQIIEAEGTAAGQAAVTGIGAAYAKTEGSSAGVGAANGLTLAKRWKGRGFGSLGSGNGDVITISGTHAAHVLQSYLIWFDARSLGETSLARIISFGNVLELFIGEGVINIRFIGWSGGNAQWHIPIPSFDSGYHSLVIRYDAGLTSNTPVVLLDNVAQTVTLQTAPSGTFTPGSGSIYIGNISVGGRTWDGLLYGLSYWKGVLLSDSEASAVATGSPPGDTQRTYLEVCLPMDRGESPEKELIAGDNGTVTGALVQYGPYLANTPRLLGGNGSSAGAGTVTGIAAAFDLTTGSSDGVATVSGQAAALVLSEGLSAGVATADAISGATAGSVGTSAGAATVLGDGEDASGGVVIIETTGTSAGSATVSGIASATALSEGIAAGVGTATGLAAGFALTTGSSAGQASMPGVAAAFALTTGSSDGTCTVLGDGTTVAPGQAEGTAHGSCTVTGISGALAQVTGTSAGFAEITAQAAACIPTIGSAAGQATLQGLMQDMNAGSTVGSSAGSSTVSGLSGAQVNVIGISNGIGLAEGISGATAQVIGTSAGVAIVLGEGEEAPQTARIIFVAHKDTLIFRSDRGRIFQSSRRAFITQAEE